MDFVKKEALIPKPSVGIHIPPSTNPQIDIEKILYPLDRQIIYSLSNDSRKTIADIADEVGAASKTVRRRLSAMIGRGLLDFSIQWYPDASNDIITLFYIKLRPDADKKTVDDIMNGYFPNMLFHYQFINVPNELFCLVWTSMMKELKDIQERMASEPVVTSIVSNTLYTGYILDTWRDEIFRPESTWTKGSES